MNDDTTVEDFDSEELTEQLEEKNSADTATTEVTGEDEKVSEQKGEKQLVFSEKPYDEKDEGYLRNELNNYLAHLGIIQEKQRTQMINEIFLHPDKYYSLLAQLSHNLQENRRRGERRRGVYGERPQKFEQTQVEKPALSEREAAQVRLLFSRLGLLIRGSNLANERMRATYNKTVQEIVTLLTTNTATRIEAQQFLTIQTDLLHSHLRRNQEQGTVGFDETARAVWQSYVDGFNGRFLTQPEASSTQAEATPGDSLNVLRSTESGASGLNFEHGEGLGSDIPLAA